MKFRGEVWRHVPKGAYALHAGFILRAQGRWNRPGLYGCLYTALTKEGAEAEYARYLARAGVNPGAIAPRDLVTIKVDIRPVIDLTKKNALVNPGELFLVGDSPDDLENCRALADIARQQEFTGIIAPSAALPEKKNLVIYIDGIAGFINLDAGSKRIPFV